MDKLHKIMERGWNVMIECKGKGRVFEMSFEATARKVITENMTRGEMIKSIYVRAHAFGDTLEKVVDSLIEQINKNDN